MAARTYFDKPARSLDVLESATLVGMLKGNSYYNPVLNPERAVARRNTVLAQMVKRGKLDEARLAALQKKPLRIDFERQLEAPGPGAPLCPADPQAAHRLGRQQRLQHLRRRAGGAHHPGQPPAGTRPPRRCSARAGSCRPWRTGLGRAQGLGGQPRWCRPSCASRRPTRGRWPGPDARGALARLLADKPSCAAAPGARPGCRWGFMAMDPRTGEVRAWVGSRDFAARPVRPRAAGAPPAGLHLQALCVRRGVRQGPSPPTR
jgi:penicillin-binding protein 1A